jgi:hypothetical protein
MISSISVSLRPEDIRSYRNLRLQLGKLALKRFKSLTEDGCVPLHIETRGGDVSLSIFPAYSTSSKPPPFLQLPPKMLGKPAAIMAEPGKKPLDHGIQGRCVDGIKLAVRSMSVVGNSISMQVSRMLWDQILALDGLGFDEIAHLEALRLDTNTHVIAMERNWQILLVGRRSMEPGEARAGATTLSAPSGTNAQWTLPVNGCVDHGLMMRSRPCQVWKDNSLKEFEEELGVFDATEVRYLGTVVDTRLFLGAIGIVGVIETPLTPTQVDDSRRRMSHGMEVPALDAVPLEMDEIAAYLRANRDRMVPQLVSGLVMLGYDRWGMDFLRAADK